MSQVNEELFPSLLAMAHQMEDGDWFAHIEEAPGCWGTGPTRDAAIDDCVDALAGWWEKSLQPEDAVEILKSIRTRRAHGATEFSSGEVEALLWIIDHSVSASLTDEDLARFLAVRAPSIDRKLAADFTR